MENSDRELLEFAAKAAGLPHKWIPMLGKMLHIIDGGNSDTWNPLDNDGDAFRLAVNLRLKIMCRTHSVEVLSEDGKVRCLEMHYQDPYAATRRAIVRAAAEIGKNMK